MYLGCELKVVREYLLNALKKLIVRLDAAGNAVLWAATLDCEKLEAFEVVVPDSEQFNLQQSFAVETAASECRNRAFLQQAGRFGSGQDASFSCAPTPTAELSNAEIRTQTVNHFRIDLRISSHQWECNKSFFYFKRDWRYRTSNAGERSPVSLRLRLCTKN